MAPLDREKILRYEADIRESQQVLLEITSEDVDEYVRDPLKIRAMKYTLIVLVEAICNLCRHVLAKRTHTVVEEYMEAILKMHGAPRASPWSLKTVPTYALGRCSASARNRQGFGGSSAGERNPPKHGRSIAGRVPIRSYAFLHGQGRGLLRRRMKKECFP
jgi:hypothetical protein